VLVRRCSRFIWVASTRVVRPDLKCLLQLPLPALICFLCLAVAMAPMGGERKSGTIELLMDPAVSRADNGAGPSFFLAAWVFIALCAAADLPIIIHGSITWVPRINGAIFTGLSGQLLLAAAIWRSARACRR